jgi:hypothetical protein
MARTTTDPKPFTVAMRLNRDDLRALERLAKLWKCSRTDVLRKLLHGEKPPKR